MCDRKSGWLARFWGVCGLSQPRGVGVAIAPVSLGSLSRVLSVL